MLDIYKKITELLEKGETFAVATIIQAEGSTPRGVGTKMIIKEDETVYGTIGGGCVESAAIMASIETLKEGKPRVVDYSLEEEEKDGIGMRCGGKVKLSIEILQPTPTLLVIGSGHIATSLTKFGKIIEFKVVVLDPFARKEDFPEADVIIAKPVDDGIAEIVAIETMSAMPIEDKVAMSLVVVARKGIKGIKAGDDIIELPNQ